MKLRPAPAVATWFLKLFCSDVEYEALVGDLTEQYQQGRGRFWYWRQVLDIVFLALYSKAVRRPLTPTPRVRILATIGSIFLIAAISVAVLLSNIATILLVGVLGGVFFGFVKFGRGDGAPAAPRRTQCSRGRSNRQFEDFDQRRGRSRNRDPHAAGRRTYRTSRAPPDGSTRNSGWSGRRRRPAPMEEIPS